MNLWLHMHLLNHNRHQFSSRKESAPSVGFKPTSRVEHIATLLRPEGNHALVTDRIVHNLIAAGNIYMDVRK